MGTPVHSENEIDYIMDPQIQGDSQQSADQQRRLVSRWRRHREVLVVSVLVVILSFVFQVRTDQKVEVTGGVWTVPELCLSRSLWGVSCPGCGLTRSFVRLAHGDFSGSVAVNRVGWLLALATVIQIPYRSVMLRWLSTRGLPEPVPELANVLFGWTLIVALIGSWIFGLLGI